jgi:hypothetical protein
MRTTINLEDDAFAMAHAYARARALKLGEAVSELIRRGGTEKLRMKQVDGVWVVDLPADAAPLTARKVQQLLDDAA